MSQAFTVTPRRCTARSATISNGRPVVPGLLGERRAG